MIYGNAVVIPPNAHNNNPITGIHFANSQPLFDTLDFLSNTFKNFFFTFDSLSNLKPHGDMNLGNTIELTESIAALLLKGKTVGKIEKLGMALESIGRNDYNLSGPQDFDIFKDRDSVLLDPAGNYNINNIAFPGYL
jgi:hypothetical protein